MNVQCHLSSKRICVCLPNCAKMCYIFQQSLHYCVWQYSILCVSVTQPQTQLTETLE